MALDMLQTWLVLLEHARTVLQGSDIGLHLSELFSPPWLDLIPEVP
jgi:hypothetical protein